MYKEYDKEILQQINNNVDLIEYASQTMDLKRRSNNYFAHCPKHVDKTPSLAFYPDTNSYYCFSCGCSGDIINFLRDFEGLNFDDAVNKAARLSKIDLSSICRSNTINFLKKIKPTFESRQVYKHEILSENEYLKYKKKPIPEWEEEGIQSDVMDLFGIRSDVMTNRIIYPVYDIDGNLINIKGRTRYANYKTLKIPKYINYFPVGKMDYFQCLNITLPYIKEKCEVIVFESIKSVMKAYGWGYKNCVSAEKHTLTNEQISLLVKLKADVVLAYDTDIDYTNVAVAQNIDKLKMITNVYIIQDKYELLGGIETKNAPVDCGKEIWEKLYQTKRKVV